MGGLGKLMIVPQEMSLGQFVPLNTTSLPKSRSPGLVTFVPGVADHFCLALPAAFTQPGEHLLAEPCTQFGKYQAVT